MSKQFPVKYDFFGDPNQHEFEKTQPKTIEIYEIDEMHHCIKKGPISKEIYDLNRMGVFQSGDKYSVPRLHDVAATQGIGGSAQWSVPSTFDCPGDKKTVNETKNAFSNYFFGYLIFFPHGMTLSFSTHSLTPFFCKYLQYI